MAYSRERLEQLGRRRDGVVTRAQALELGASTAWITRRVTTGQWQRVQPGVFVTHSGPLLWRTRAHAAVLGAGPGAALSHRSAAFLYGMLRDEPTTLEVSVPAARRVVPPQGTTVYRRRRMPAAGGRLPVVARPDTVVDAAGTMTTPDEVITLVVGAMRCWTAADDILAAIAARAWVPQRRLLEEMLGEAVDGIESALERRYHRDVERRHHLPASRLQVRQRLGGRWIRADRIHEGLGVRIELDGELAHPGGRTDRDVWRDNLALIVHGDITLRYRWRHVLAPCATAQQVEQALQARSWPGRGRPCGSSCPVGG